MSKFNEKLVDVSRYGSKSQQQLELERLDERFGNSSFDVSQTPMFYAQSKTNNHSSISSINETIQPVVSKEERMSKLNAEREEEDFVRKMLFNRAIANNAVILPTGQLISDVDNKTIVSNLHTHVSDGKNIKEVETTLPTDSPLRETTPDTALASVSTPKSTFNVSNNDLQNVKLNPTPMKLERSDSESSSSSDTGKAISFSTNSDEHDLPLLNMPASYIADILPSGLLSLFNNNGRIRNSELIFKLSNYLKNLSKRNISQEQKDRIKSYVNNLINELRGYSVNTFIKFDNPKIKEGGATIPPLGRLLNQIRQERKASNLRNNYDWNKPRDIQFGNVLLNENDLYNGVLNVKRKNGTRFANFSKRGISKDLAKLIYDISQGKTYQVDFNKLSHIEQDIIARLIKVSRLDKEKTFTEKTIQIPPTKQAIETELKRLIGEINAGNDSIMIKNKLGNIVSYLENYHSFNPNLAKQIIKQYVL